MTWESRYDLTIEEIEDFLRELREWREGTFDPTFKPKQFWLAVLAHDLIFTATDFQRRRQEEEARQSVINGSPNALAFRLSYWDEVRNTYKK